MRSSTPHRDVTTNSTRASMVSRTICFLPQAKAMRSRRMAATQKARMAGNRRTLCRVFEEKYASRHDERTPPFLFHQYDRDPQRKSWPALSDGADVGSRVGWRLARSSQRRVCCFAGQFGLGQIIDVESDGRT